MKKVIMKNIISYDDYIVFGLKDQLFILNYKTQELVFSHTFSDVKEIWHINLHFKDKKINFILGTSGGYLVEFVLDNFEIINHTQSKLLKYIAAMDVYKTKVNITTDGIIRHDRFIPINYPGSGYAPVVCQISDSTIAIGYDGILEIVDIPTNTVLGEYVLSDIIVELSFLENTNELLIGTFTEIAVLNMKQKQLNSLEQDITFISFYKSIGKNTVSILCSGLNQGIFIIVFKGIERTRYKIKKDYEPPIYSAALSADEAIIFLANQDMIECWDIEKQQKLWIFDRFQGIVKG
jgi:hypothetical protein